MYKVVQFDNEEEHINSFLHLPKTLYNKNQLMQNEAEERALLCGSHVLNKYFKLYKFIVYSGSIAVARCMITIYPDDRTAYIGFFECIDDLNCSRALFLAVDDFLIKLGYTQVTGPVNCSFWLQYRLKINRFDDLPYVSEPYNLPYYLKLFEDSGYNICENYVSNIYNKLPLFNHKKGKYVKRYEEFTSKGYKIVSPSKAEFKVILKSIYGMLITLYCDFPIFKYISEEDFYLHFNYFESILDFRMVKIVYKNDEIVGFFIGLPDYKNLLVGKITLFTRLKIALKKIRAGNYVMLYMGVKSEHKGLGSAITQAIIEHVYRMRSTSIGAFIKVGKVTGNYVKDSIKDKYKYVLLTKKLDEKE